MTYVALIILVLVVLVETPAVFRYISAFKKMTTMVMEYDKQSPMTEQDLCMFKMMIRSVYGPHRIWWAVITLPWRVLSGSRPSKKMAADFQSLGERHPTFYEDFCREWHRAVVFASPTVWAITIIQSAIIAVTLLTIIAFLGNIRIALIKIKQLKDNINTQLFMRC